MPTNEKSAGDCQRSLMRYFTYYFSNLDQPDGWYRKRPNDAPSFPLDRARGLAGDVVDDAVDAADLVDDPRGGLAEDFPGELEEVGGHAVGRGDRAQGQDVFVGAGVAHDAYRLDRQQHGEGLPDLVVEAGVADLFQIDGVGVLQD